MDFENFSVDNERAHVIRERLRRLRESECVAALSLLVTEFGRDELEASADGSLPGLGRDSEKTRVFETGREIGGEARLVRVEQSGPEIRLLVDGRRLLDLSFLPKNSDFLVNSLAPESEDELLQSVLSGLADDARRAKSRKADRQASFRAKFSAKSESKDESKTEAEAGTETPAPSPSESILG